MTERQAHAAGPAVETAFDDTGRWLAADGAPKVTVRDFAGKGPTAPACACSAPTTR